MTCHRAPVRAAFLRLASPKETPWNVAAFPAEISECSSSPCQNGGTCLEGLDHFKCLCPPQWTGTTCQYQAQTGG